MKGYVFDFPGMWIRGTVVVIAKDARKARHIVLKSPNLKYLNLDPKDIKIQRTFKIEECIVYLHNDNLLW